MAEDRLFPPTARRRALAHRAGFTAASPVLGAAAACVAATFAIALVGRAAVARLGELVVAAVSGRAMPGIDVTAEVVAIVLPVAAAAAAAAAIAQVVQARALWLPHRRVAGAPVAERRAVRAAVVELASAAVVGATAFGWIWGNAPRLGELAVAPLATAGAIGAALATLAIAWVAIGVGDALLRHASHARALRMTAGERREDARLAGADPRWREARARIARDGEPREAIAGSTVLVLGDGVAVAIAWDAHRRPIPLRTAIGRGARATQLLALARRAQLPVHREPVLAHELAAAEGAVPERHWLRLAEVIAAIG